MQVNNDETEYLNPNTMEVDHEDDSEYEDCAEMFPHSAQNNIHKNMCLYLSSAQHMGILVHFTMQTDILQCMKYFFFLT